MPQKIVSIVFWEKNKPVSLKALNPRNDLSFMLYDILSALANCFLNWVSIAKLPFCLPEICPAKDSLRREMNIDKCSTAQCKLLAFSISAL